MNSLRNIQHAFLGHLLDHSNTGIVSCIESNAQCSADQRIAFYENAYRLRLREALTVDYERLHGYLGDELFETLVQQYITRYPSHHPSLRYFGQYMVELVELLEPFKQLPEIAEIARIEQAFANSFDAADCQCATLNQLTQLEPEAWASLSLHFHDAVQLLAQRYNSFQIWRALSNDELPPTKEVDDSTWLIWRNNMISRYRALDEAEATALNVALSTGSFANVCECLLDYFSEQDVPLKAVGYLQQWVNDQMLCGIN